MEGGGGSGKSGRGGVGSNRSTRGVRDRGEKGERYQEGDDELREGGGPGEGSFWGGAAGRRRYVASGGTDPK